MRQVRVDVEELANREEVARLPADPACLSGPDLDRRDVNALAVDLEVAVRDELAGLAHGQREPEPERDRVGAGLQLAEELLAGDALAPLGAFEVAAELALADAVDRAELLLLDQSHLVLGEPLAAAAVQARRIGTLVRRAIGASADGRANAPADPMTGTDLLHRPHRVQEVS